MLIRVAALFDTCLNALAGRISILRSFSGRVSKESNISQITIHTIQVVNRIFCQVIFCDIGLTVVNIDGIQTICPEQEVMTAAADRHQHLDVFPILNDQHVAGLFAFHRCFIDDIRQGQTVLWQRGLIVALHNSDRTLCSKLIGDPFSCQRALSLSRMFIDRLLNNSLYAGNLLNFFLLLTAADKHGNHQCSRQGKRDNSSDTFFHNDIPLFYIQ